MEKNSMDLMDKALAILKQEYSDNTALAYASFAGYAIASVDLKTAQHILTLVENRGL